MFNSGDKGGCSIAEEFPTLVFLMPGFFVRKLLRSGYNVDVCMFIRLYRDPGQHSNRMVVEPKRFVEEVIEHPNHSLRI